MIGSVVKRDFFMGPPVDAKVDLVGPNRLAHSGGNGGGTLRMHKMRAQRALQAPLTSAT